MKIRDIRAVGLVGATPEGGWSSELRPEDSVHTLVAVLTDEGVTGVGSVFTNVALVKGALAVMEPLWRGENALEPERVSEKLHQHTFWLGRGGSLTHAISGTEDGLIALDFAQRRTQVLDAVAGAIAGIEAGEITAVGKDCPSWCAHHALGEAA